MFPRTLKPVKNGRPDPKNADINNEHPIPRGDSSIDVKGGEIERNEKARNKGLPWIGITAD
jgi:hypothetical protein